jgi:hypothetical protein
VGVGSVVEGKVFVVEEEESLESLCKKSRNLSFAYCESGKQNEE